MDFELLVLGVELADGPVGSVQGEAVCGGRRAPPVPHPMGTEY